MVFAITDDRVTPHAFAAAFRDELRAANAMFLDGEISELYAAPGSPRSGGGPFASIIGVVATAGAP